MNRFYQPIWGVKEDRWDEGVEWEVDAPYPDNPDDRSADDWFQFLVRIHFSTGSPQMALRTMDDGYWYMVSRTYRGETVRFLIYQPRNPANWLVPAGGWKAPCCNALVWHTPHLDEDDEGDEQVRAIVHKLVSSNWQVVHRVRHINPRLFNIVRPPDEWLAGDTREEKIANFANGVTERWLTGEVYALPSLAKDGVTPLPTSFALNVGWAHIPKNKEEPWYWFDTEEVFQRLFDERRFLGKRPLPRSAGERPPLRVWYEQPELKLRRITEVRMTDDYRLYNPPDNGPIPSQVMALRSAHPLTFVSQGVASWKYGISSSDATPTADEDFDADWVDDEANAAELAFASSWDENVHIIVESHVEPDYVGRVFFRGHRATLDVAYQAAVFARDEAQEYQRWMLSRQKPPETLADHSRAPRKDLLHMARKEQEIIDRLEDASDLEDALRPDHQTLLNRERAKTRRLEQYAVRLNNAFTEELINVVRNRADPATLEAFRIITDSMHQHPVSQNDFRRKMRGFLADPTDTEAHLTRIIFIELWNRVRKHRNKLVDPLLKVVQADLHESIKSVRIGQLKAPFSEMVENMKGVRMHNTAVTLDFRFEQQAPASDVSATEAGVSAAEVEALNVIHEVIQLGMAVQDFQADDSNENLQKLIKRSSSFTSAAIDATSLGYKMRGKVPPSYFDVIKSVKGGLDLALEVISLGDQLAGYNDAVRGSSPAHANAVAFSLFLTAGSTVTSAAALAGLTALTTGPVGIVVGLLGLTATLWVAATAPTPLEEVFRMTYFGKDYAKPEPDAEYPEADWYENVGLQIAHINSMLFSLDLDWTWEPIEGEDSTTYRLTARTISADLGYDSGIGSRVVFHVWPEGDGVDSTPLARTRGWFVLRPADREPLEDHDRLEQAYRAQYDVGDHMERGHTGRFGSSFTVLAGKVKNGPDLGKYEIQILLTAEEGAGIGGQAFFDRAALSVELRAGEEIDATNYEDYYKNNLWQARTFKELKSA